MNNEMKPKAMPAPVKWSLALAIVIVLNLLFYYGIAFVYPEPKFEKFCPVRTETYTDANSCVMSGGQWSNYPLAPTEITKAVKNGDAIGYCDPNFTCNTQFTDAHSTYNRNAFAVLIILGIVSILIGVFIANEALSLGLMGGGLLALVIASFRYWSDADNWMRVVILVIALGVLIWITIKKFRKQ
jgi:hypothetical protein